MRLGPIFFKAMAVAITTGLLLFPCSILHCQENWRACNVEVKPGQSRSVFLAVPRGPDGDTQIPVTLIHGIRQGPTLALIAGNHGYEYPPILAAQRIAAKMDPKKLSGKIIIVHIANMPSFLKRTVYYSPIDGKNLNRVYPGKADGTISERIAYSITHEVIEQADYLVDLHCGDGNEALRPYSYWMPINDPKVDEASKQMALAFGIAHIVIDRSRPKDPSASLYCSNTAATRGKPAITIESGEMGVALDEVAVSRIERGIQNLLRHFGMIEGTASIPKKVQWYDPVQLMLFPDSLREKAGIFYPSVQRGQLVEKGALLGYVTDFFGKRIFELRAPLAGEVLYIISTPPVSAGEPLAFVGGLKKS